MEKVKKIGKVQALIILVLVVVVIMLFPIPMSHSRTELFQTTETYYDETPIVVNETVLVPYAVNETISVPYSTTETVSVPCQIVKNMQWQVTWYTLTVARQWGAAVGSQLFDSTFRYDWGSGIVYGGYSDGIGFSAAASFYLEAAGMYTFTLSSDDGAILYLDQSTVINMWSDGSHSTVNQLWWVSTGWHNIKIDYYEWTGTARIRFDIDKGDLLTWEETQNYVINIPRIYYNTVQVPKIYYNSVIIPREQSEQIPKERNTVENRTITETAFFSLV